MEIDMGLISMQKCVVHQKLRSASKIISKITKL